jgi:Kef-type K+ transport system membrane component KefB
MHDFVTLALQLAVMLACGVACGQLMARLKQPAVLGEMIGGILLGPTVLGMLWPEMYAGLFPVTGMVADLRNGVVKLGMLFFLFLVGLEIHFTDLRKHGWGAILIGLTATLIPLGCGVAIVYLFPDLWGLTNESLRFPFALFIGASMANTANPVLARILYDLGLLRKDFGVLLLTATVIDDLVAWGVLMFVVGQFQHAASPAGAAAESPAVLSGLVVAATCLVAIVVLGRLLGAPLLRLGHGLLSGRSGTIAVIAMLVLATAALSEWLGIHAFLGPFFLGIAMSSTADEHRPAYDVVQQFSLGFFVPIYFVSMGLAANFVSDFVPWVVLIVFVTACLSKMVSAYAGARLAGLDNGASWAVGWGMNARGATGIILAGIGLDHRIIGQPIYVALVITCLATSLMAGPLMKLFLGSRPEPVCEPAPESQLT